MAIALTPSSNYTPGQNHRYLNAWPQLMTEDIWHFNQCAGIGAPMQTANDKGGGVYLQKEREYIARTLEAAAGRMAQDLNYWINPAYFSQEIPIGKGRPIGNQLLQTRYCKMIELGKRATALIEADVVVNYNDPNSVGVQDTATVTVNSTLANGEIKLYFRTADGAPTACDYRYEVEPLTVTDNGAGVVTLKGHRSLFVKPSEWAREYVAGDPNFNSPNIVDTATAAGFVQKVDVYRVYTDTSANIQMLASDGTLLHTYTGNIVNAELGVFRLGDLCATWCSGRPSSIVVNYRAGSPLVNGFIDSELYEAAAAYAAGSMQSKLTKMSYWTLESWIIYHSPMVEKSGGGMIPTATKTQSNSSYGARTGQALAWTVVLDRRIEKGHKFF